MVPKIGDKVRYTQAYIDWENKTNRGRFIHKMNPSYPTMSPYNIVTEVFRYGDVFVITLDYDYDPICGWDSWPEELLEDGTQNSSYGKSPVVFEKFAISKNNNLIEPENNDNRSKCFWCGKDTKKIQGFRSIYNFCSNCNK